MASLCHTQTDATFLDAAERDAFYEYFILLDDDPGDGKLAVVTDSCSTG
jgi:hypothetical protein